MLALSLIVMLACDQNKTHNSKVSLEQGTVTLAILDNKISRYKEKVKNG